MENNQENLVDNEIESQEPQEHHSGSDINQNNDDELSPSSVNENSSDLNEPEDSSIEADKSSDAPEAHDEQKSKSEIPQWGKDNPEKWGKYKARQKEKEYEAKLKQKEEEIEYFHKILSNNLNVNNPPVQNQEVNNNIIHDPKTGMPIDINTPEGESLAKEILLENKRNEFQNQVAYENYAKRQHEHEMLLAEKIEEAKFKYKDYDEVVSKSSREGKFTRTMIDFAALMNDNDSGEKSNGADFLYYLAKNPNEMSKIKNMNIYDQYKSLYKHAINFNSRSPQVSKAPPPVKPLQGFSGSPDDSSYESSKARMKARYSKPSLR